MEICDHCYHKDIYCEADHGNGLFQRKSFRASTGKLLDQHFQPPEACLEINMMLEEIAHDRKLLAH